MFIKVNDDLLMNLEHVTNIVISDFDPSITNDGACVIFEYPDGEQPLQVPDYKAAKRVIDAISDALKCNESFLDLSELF